MSNINIELTEIIASIAHLDNVLCRAARHATDDGIISITVDPLVFQAIANARPQAVIRNRIDLAGVIIRKDHGLIDTTQPEIKKRAS